MRNVPIEPEAMLFLKISSNDMNCSDETARLVQNDAVQFSIALSLFRIANAVEQLIEYKDDNKSN